jgi:hypothetical protein
MLPYSTLRDFFRIPWVHDNREAVHYLSNMFYLLIALYRSGRKREYYIVRNVFFEMFDSFAIYGRSQARDVLGDLLQIPWFHEHQRDLYRLISIFKHITSLLHDARRNNNAAPLQQETNKNVEEFIVILKALNNFNHRDESRINDLLSRADLLDALMDNLLPDQDSDSTKSEDHESTGYV